MKTAEKILIIIFLMVCADSITAAGGLMKSDTCIKKYEISRGTSPWQGFTSNYAEEEESKKIKSVAMKNSEYKAVPGLEKYSRSDLVPVGRNEKLRRVGVEAELFSDLRRGDATRNSNGRFSIGTYKDTSFSFFKPAELAEFLIESQIINTFWHVEADICLVSEDDTAASYAAHYKGKHFYFTNSKNVEPLDFTVIIEKKSGNIFLEAR